MPLVTFVPSVATDEGSRVDGNEAASSSPSPTRSLTATIAPIAPAANTPAIAACLLMVGLLCSLLSPWALAVAFAFIMPEEVANSTLGVFVREPEYTELREQLSLETRETLQTNTDLLVVGTAAVVDTVLLLAVLERRNWRRVSVPVVLLIGGVWLWHVGDFVHLLVSGVRGPVADAVQWTSMMAMAAGLLLMPSAMLHGALRLRRRWLREAGVPTVEESALFSVASSTSGGRLDLGGRGATRPPVPLVLVIAPGARELARDPQAAFLDLVGPWIAPYLSWLGFALVVCSVTFLRVRKRVTHARSRQFFAWMAAVLVGFAGLLGFVFLYAREAWPEAERTLVLAVTVYPVLASAVFAFFVIRYGFAQLVLERTLVYGGIVVAFWLLHHLAWEGVAESLGDRYGVNFAILEGVAIIALVLAYAPLRRRTSEALRYLMGSRVHLWRERVRALTAEMTALVGQRPPELLEWFLREIREPARVDSAAGWLLDARGEVTVKRGDVDLLSDEQVATIVRELESSRRSFCTRHDAPERGTRQLLRNVEATLAVLLKLEDGHGLILLGRHRRHRELSEEETSALLLLVEQLGVTIRNGVLQEERIAAERRALQSEKLSTLGLLASSIAHEVKNPLSSIKTIATVLAEELGAKGEHEEELRLILSEVDRLSSTTSQLLDFARPASPSPGDADLARVLDKTLGVLKHLARQRNVEIETSRSEGPILATANENALREILLNLFSNSIEAAGHGGHVRASCTARGGMAELEVSDDGPGIPSEIQDRLFEPFVTSKDSGTGLGLYVVGRRVREIGGEIHCESASGHGTRFTVKIPLKEANEAHDSHRG